MPAPVIFCWEEPEAGDGTCSPAAATNSFSFPLSALSVGGKTQLQARRYPITSGTVHSRGFVVLRSEEGKGLRGSGGGRLASPRPPLPGCFPLSNEPLSRRVTVSRRHGAGRDTRTVRGLAGMGGTDTPGAARGSAGECLGRFPRPPSLRPGAAGGTAGAEPGRGSVVVTWRRGGSRGGGVGPSRSRRRSGSGERRSREGGRGGREVRGAGAGAGREPGRASGRRRAPPR